MAICEKCIKQSVCKLCDGSEIMGCIEFVSLNKVIMNGQPLPDGCEILTKEAYADLCVRASKCQEPNCSEIPTGSEKLSSALEKNSKKLEKAATKNDLVVDVPDNNVGNIDCISRADAIHAVSEALKHTFVEYEDIANKVIGKLPPVIPQEPRKGHWKSIKGNFESYVKCPICGKCSIDQRTYVAMNFCPNCGAEMKEVEE